MCLKMKTAHTRCHRGKRVLVFLCDGTSFVDHFESYGSSWVRFRVAGKVAKMALRAMSIAKGVVCLTSLAGGPENRGNLHYSRRTSKPKQQKRS